MRAGGRERRRRTPSPGSPPPPRWRGRAADRSWRRRAGGRRRSSSSCISEAPRRVDVRRSQKTFLSPPKNPWRAELRGEHADAGAVAQHVVVAEHVDDVEPRLHLAEGGQGEPAASDADVEPLIGRVRRVVRVHDAPPQAAARDEVDADARAPPEIGSACGCRDELAVVGDDVVLLDVRKSSAEKSACDEAMPFAHCRAAARFPYPVNPADDVGAGQLDAVRCSRPVVERREERPARRTGPRRAGSRPACSRRRGRP